jgi:hypothetical protein
VPSPRHAALALAVLAQPLLSAAAPAGAVEVAGLSRTIPTMTLEIEYRSGYHHVCATGKLNGQDQPSEPTWTVVVAGTRSDGSVIAQQTSEVSSVGDLCLDVQKLRTDAGEYDVTFSYHGLGNDLPSAIGALGLWAADRNHQVVYGQET